MTRGFVKVWAHIIRSKPATTKVLSVRIFSGLGGRLLLAFSLMALLTLSASLLGWIGLTHLRQLEQGVQQTLADQERARTLARLSGEIQSASHLLATATSEAEREHQGRLLTLQGQQMQRLLAQLGGEGERQVQEQLHPLSQAIIGNLGQQGWLVGERLTLMAQGDALRARLVAAAGEVAELARSQMENAETVMVAGLGSLYPLQGRAAAAAIDRLLEQDLDWLEQMTELRHRTLMQQQRIEEIWRGERQDRLQALLRDGQRELAILQLRAGAVTDPARRQGVEQALAVLAQSDQLVQLRSDWLGKGEALRVLASANEALMSSLNQQVDDLVNRARDSLGESQQALSQRLKLLEQALMGIGLLTLVLLMLLMWRMVYGRIVWPLQHAVAGMSRLARGDLAPLDPIVGAGSDELAELGRALQVFRDNAVELGRYQRELESRVVERTRQLSHANLRLNEEVENQRLARAEAEQANRAKSVFLATMSHEIRTPMNGILGGLTLLEDTHLSETQRRYLAAIEHSGESLLEILNDILDYSKIEAGHLEARREPFPLHQLVDELSALFRPKAEARGVALVLEYAPALPPVVEGDLGKLRQVLGNLLGNAVKFTARGRICLEVSPLPCGGPCAEPCILFVVSDTGPGIPEQEQEAVFEAFRQRKRDMGHQGGTGLGLAISRRLVAAMGGELCLASRPGEGCRFSFSLPLQRSAAQLPAAAQPLHLGQPRDILLVEDNEINRLVAHGMLVRLGHSVTLAEDGRSALARVTERGFDLALLDINLPDMDGLTLREDLAAISEEVHERPLPAIAISAQMYPEDIRLCLEAGFADFVGKPVRLAALASAIDRQFQGETTQAPPGAREGTVNPPAPQAANPVLDADLALLGSQRIRQLIGLFESQGAALVAALVRCEGEERKGMAHKLKGSALALGLDDFAAQCAALEAGEGDPAGLAGEFYAAVATLKVWQERQLPTPA